MIVQVFNPDGTRGWVDKPLEEWTEEEMRRELSQWESSTIQRMNRIIDYIEREATFLRLENEKLWKVAEGGGK